MSDASYAGSGLIPLPEVLGDDWECYQTKMINAIETQQGNTNERPVGQTIMQVLVLGPDKRDKYMIGRQ